MTERIHILPPLPIRPIDGHKGLFGRVFVIGGQKTMLGAPSLAGRAALKMGAGLVQVATPRSVLPFVLAITPELIGAELESPLKSDLEKADAIVLGLGIGQSAKIKKVVADCVKADVRKIIDADALNILAAGRSWPKTFKNAGVITPHPGEMKRLNQLLKLGDVPKDDAGRMDNAVRASKAFKVVVVLKGNRTVVADGDRVYVNKTGNSALSKAGSGDVLSGIIGTLLAQAMDPFSAACAATWIHGRAGELAGEKLGLRSVLAHDVIESLSTAIAEYERRAGNAETSTD